LGAIGSEIKVGSIVLHARLGKGVVLEVGKNGCLVNYTSKQGILVRGSAFQDLEVIYE
tara:strand:- start:366 stop:539 length:174 start_codon:yes stop_codon:yes gene_type:complete